MHSMFLTSVPTRQLICEFIIASDIIISAYIHVYVHSHMHASLSVNTHILFSHSSPSPIKSPSKQVMNGHATGWSLHGWPCGPIWSTCFNMGPFASQIIRVENLMDTPDCPRMPLKSFCVGAHSQLNYTHDPCKKLFGLCQHPPKKILSLLTCPYIVVCTQCNVSLCREYTHKYALYTPPPLPKKTHTYKSIFHFGFKFAPHTLVCVFVFCEC